MKSISNKKGVFGLTSVQQFFAIILGLGLLAYVIVVIMGTLSDSTILPVSSLSGYVINETGGWLNKSGYPLAQSTLRGFTNPVITRATNVTDGTAYPAINYTVTATGVIATSAAIGGMNLTTGQVYYSYTYNYNSDSYNNAKDVLTNTSGGITSFFSAINPVYAILAILVIILILVVLVRVVTGGTPTGGQTTAPQL
jgi:hypothetical protein